MSRREGQERVEVRPGVFLWLNEADRKRHAALSAGQEPPAPDTSDKRREFGTVGVETASVEPAENAAMPVPKPKVAGRPG